MTLPFVPSPPLAPDALQLVYLMQRAAYIAKWQELFQGAVIRATTDRGRVATVRLEDIEALLAAGAIERAHGGSFVLTETGRAI